MRHDDPHRTALLTVLVQWHEALGKGSAHRMRGSGPSLSIVRTFTMPRLQCRRQEPAMSSATSVWGAGSKEAKARSSMALYHRASRNARRLSHVEVKELDMEIGVSGV